MAIFNVVGYGVFCPKCGMCLLVGRITAGTLTMMTAEHQRWSEDLPQCENVGVWRLPEQDLELVEMTKVEG